MVTVPTKPPYYDPTYDQFPELRFGVRVLAPVRVGMDRKTGKLKIGWDHTFQSMQVIFMTRFHERVLRRWVGSFIPHLLGELENPRTITRFYWAIGGAIDMWEPNYSITRVLIRSRRTGSDDEVDNLTSPEEFRMGHLTTINEGVHMPRGHLGDKTPEVRITAQLAGWRGTWGAA